MIPTEVLLKAKAAGLQLENMSPAELIALDPEVEQAFYSKLSDEELIALRYEWRWWARPKQLPPSPLPYILLFQTGRGFGKTRSAAEMAIERAASEKSRLMGVLAPTSAVCRDVVVNGPSGILSNSPPWFMPVHNKTSKTLTWPNGVVMKLFSSEKPELIRGAGLDWLWIEEACALNKPEECFSNAFFALRESRSASCIITTTPKRQHYILEKVREIQAKSPSKVHIVRGHTLENRSNLSEESVNLMMDTYGDTRLGKQELAGEELLDVPGAFWTEGQLDNLRVAAAPQLKRVVVGVDPAISDNARSDENGIVVSGRGVDDHLYTLGDYSIHGNSIAWGRALFRACVEHPVGKIVAETVRGGNLIRRNIEMVWEECNREREASGLATVVIPEIVEINSQELDKMGRFELFSGLWEQGKAHSVGRLEPVFPLHEKGRTLEFEMCNWNPKESKYSPNKIDGLILGTENLYPERGNVRITSAKAIEVPLEAYAAKRPVRQERRPWGMFSRRMF